MTTGDTQNAQKKIILSGIQPTGTITLGNYLGAVQNWQRMQADFNSIFFIADLHALTVRREPAEFRQTAINFFAQLLACGISPENAIIHFQSHVRQHAELAWILNCNTYVGEASRMTQFKDKSAKHADNVNMGLMDYPVLIAADILLYQTDLVPVGADQKQHLEIARDLAVRFNNRYGETFRVPEPYIMKEGAKICSLQEPDKKMSKSDENLNASVFLSDDRDTVIRKFKRAVTDSGNEIRASEEKKGVTNLLTIYAAFKNCTVAEAEREFEGKGYGDFKLAVGETVADALAPVQEEQRRLLADREYVSSFLKAGQERAFKTARKTLSKVYRKVGFYQGD